MWDVRRAYVDAAWQRNRNPQHDVAILEMTPRGGRNVEDVTGAAPRLGRAPAPGTRTTVDGYLAGSGGTPITCTTHSIVNDGFPRFDCDGYASGVSGGPWLAGGRVVGVTGGLHQGGCDAATSFSSAFGRQVFALLARARASGPGDHVGLPGPDGC